jgi:hypothetical protein
MQPRRQMRVRSATAYGAAMLLASAYCVFHSLSALPLALGVAALSVLSAAAIGYGLGGWYLWSDSDQPTFELVAVPLLAFLGGPLVGASVFMFGAVVLSQPGAPDNSVFSVYLAVPMTMAYISLSWPVALPAFTAAAIAMARFSRRGSNNSFKPNPLRGSA